MPLAPVEVSKFLSRVLPCCLEARAVWSMDTVDGAKAAPGGLSELLLFADRRALHALSRSDHLHRADVELLVVFDGDRFENAWGERRLSGSLARWAWRQVAPQLAYYDQSKWDDAAGSGTVVRVRKRAMLLWERAWVH